MTNDDAKTAFFKRTPVTYNGITYERITQIIYWLDEKNNLHISLTLADKNKNSFIQARVEDVTIYDNQNQGTAFVS